MGSRVTPKRHDAMMGRTNFVANACTCNVQGPSSPPGLLSALIGWKAGASLGHSTKALPVRQNKGRNLFAFGLDLAATHKALV